MNVRKQIFVVEDEPIIRDDIAAKLGDLGYAVCGEADSAAAALSELPNLSPDLCLLDISIEGAIDGIDLAREIKRRFFKPVVFLTSFSDTLTLERAKAVEPAGYILKPICESTSNWRCINHRERKKALAPARRFSSSTKG
jgi:DNA-binding NarL/FixJ family response regulator